MGFRIVIIMLFCAGKLSAQDDDFLERLFIPNSTDSIHLFEKEGGNLFLEIKKKAAQKSVLKLDYGRYLDDLVRKYSSDSRRSLGVTDAVFHLLAGDSLLMKTDRTGLYDRLLTAYYENLFNSSAPARLDIFHRANSYFLRKGNNLSYPKIA